MKTLYLVRHGATQEAEGRCIGQFDLPLSAEGAEQMRRLGGTWPGKPPDRLVSSDLRRARESAELLASRWRLPVRTDGRLRELHFGLWEGRSWCDLERDEGGGLARWMEAWWTLTPPSGESLNDMLFRTRAWLLEVFGEASEDILVAVTHAGPIRGLLAEVLRLSPSELFRFRIDPASVSGLAGTLPDLEVFCVNSPGFPHRPLVFGERGLS